MMGVWCIRFELSENEREKMTNETKKQPQPGEFWQTRGGERRFVVAILPVMCDSNFPVLSVNEHTEIESHAKDGNTDIGTSWPDDLVKHLPWCTSFDDTDPVAETWPKYFEVTACRAFVRRDSETSAVYVYADGKETPFGEWDEMDSEREQLTESEALSRLTPPEDFHATAESWTRSLTKCPDCGEFRGHGHEDVCPMAWVEITHTHLDHVPREGIDHVTDSGTDARWFPCKGKWTGHLGNMSDCKFRCRRKDLPPIPQPVATPATPDPGEGWRLLEKGTTLFEGDEGFAGNGEWLPCGIVGQTVQCGIYRRRITPAAKKCSPIEAMECNSCGDFCERKAAETPPEKIRLQFWVPRRIQDGDISDVPVRATIAGEKVADVATWIPAKSDADGFYVEKPQ
jgi:hypothetical protein